MSKLLWALCNSGEIVISNPNLRTLTYRIFRYSDGELIGVRREDSLTGPIEPCTKTGLKKILNWIDEN